MANNYQKRKEQARQEAIGWKNSFALYSYSFEELYYIANRLKEIGKRYGLLKEFRENGIV